MRLLIESRRLTIELASTKVAAADKSNANTLASEREPERPSTDRSSPTKLQDRTGDPVGPKDSSVHQYTQLPRRKSIHKRLGRILLRVSRMCSDVQCSMYAYQYGSGVAELPEGGSQVDRTPSLCEMPGSFPRAELESYGIQTSSAHCRAANRSYEDAAPEHLQNYYKANQNATLRRAAPMSVTNLSQLPRLEVPQSQHCVPRLMTDCSPLTPSPISPITPSTGGYNGQAGLPMHFDTISPCGDSKTSQTYTHYGTWDHLPSMTPATPCATTSCISSLASTPLSAYPSTASSPFYHWPQPQPEVQLPRYSQGLLHPDHAHSPNGTTLRRAFSWQSPAQVQSYNSSDTSHSCQMHHYQSNIPSIREPLNSPAHAQSCFEKQDLLARAPPTPMFPETQYFFDDIPPAYSPVIADTQPPLTNPQRRYLPSVCQHCGKSFTGKYGPGNCKRHIQQTHETFVDRAIHVCRLCVKSYNRADALRKHQWKKHRLQEAKPRKRRDRGSEQTRVG